MVRFLRTLLAALALLLAWGSQAQDLQPVPALSQRVVDTTGTLSGDARQALIDQLAALERERGTQLVILLVATTQPEDIAAYAHRVADTWRVGRREVGDGLLIVVAVADRKLRIEVAKTLEGAVPDLAARAVIDRTLKPAFRSGDYAGGLSRAVEELAARIRGENLPLPDSREATFDEGVDGAALIGLLPWAFVGLPVIGMVLTAFFGRRLGTVAAAGGAGALTWWFSQSWVLALVLGLVALVVVALLGLGARLGRSGARRSSRADSWSSGPSWGGGGGWSSGGSSDSFSSGGGGDFGGGGASGDW
jgi:uncharacterized protein